LNINPQAPLVARKEVFIQASPEVVWEIHTAIDDWPRWHPGVDTARLEGPLAAGSAFRWKSGGLSIASTLQVVEPNQRIGWTGRALGTRASQVWMFEAQGDGTMLRTEESMQGWLVGILKLLMPGFLEESLDTWLESLKREAESRGVGGVKL